MDNQLPWFDKEHLEHLLTYEDLVDALHDGFTRNFSVPLRHHHYWGAHNDELLVMPAWDNKSLVVKLVTLCPENPKNNLPSNGGVLVLFDAQNGSPLAMMDAGELTARRTAAASALASKYLSREDSDSLLVVGSGRLVSYLVEAHLTVRDITKVRIWGRDCAQVQNVMADIRPLLTNEQSCEAVNDLQEAAKYSDIISAATRSTTPVIRGAWVTPGTHIDLVGGYRPDMREVDSAGIRKSSIFADTIDGVLAESGDIIQPLENGDIKRNDIKGELADLCRKKHTGRTRQDEITLFKSVGTAFEDLIAARMALKLFESAAMSGAP